MSTRRYGRAIGLLLAPVVILVVGCGGGGDGPTCSAGEPRIDSYPPVVATVGRQYVYWYLAPYPCFPWGLCNSVDPLLLPPGAGIDEVRDLVYWTPSPEQADTDVAFSIASAPNLCGDRATQSWTVRVHAAPVIESFAASSGARRGEAATLTAVFQGVGHVEEIGPVASGVPLATPPLSSSGRFTLVVSNGAGFSVRQTVVVDVPSPPAIHSLSASPTAIAGGIGASSRISWTVSGVFTVARLEPLGIDVRNVTSVTVTPAETTTYALHLADDVGATATASVQVEVVPMPAIESFVADPPATVLGGTVSLTARFQGTGRIDPLNDGAPNSSLGAVTSAEPIVSPPLRRYTGFRLVVADAFGRTVSRDLFVEVTGPGTFRPTRGQPLEPQRIRHSATLLADGRVLIAGGVGSDSTEIYDPASETFTPGPRLLRVRQRHSGVLLQDGRVLLVGGGGHTAMASAELYDPRSGTISATAWSAPDYGTAVRVPDGRVFFGAFGGGFTIDATATSRSEGILSGGTHAGCLDALTRLDDGRVLAVLGAPSPSMLFLPTSDSAVLTGAALHNRGCGFKATALGDGRALISGGDIFPGPLAEIYDPANGRFSAAGSQQHFAYNGTASVLANGDVLLAGGSLGFGGSRLPRAEVFDPSTGSFAATGGMRTGRREHTATVLPEGSVLVVGGCEALPCESELYAP